MDTNIVDGLKKSSVEKMYAEREGITKSICATRRHRIYDRKPVRNA